MNENGGRGNTVLLTVIGIATLLVVVVGATFAFFAAQITGDSASEVVIQTAQDGTVVEFVGSNQNDVHDIYPRETAWSTQPFSVTSTGGNEVAGSGTVTYTFTLNYNNGFTGDAAGIQYEVVEKQVTDGAVSDVAKSKTDLPTAGTSLTLGTVRVARGSAFTASYELNIYYKNTGANQNTGSAHTLTYYVSFESSI